MASTIASLADTQSLSEIDSTWTNQTVTLTDNTDYTLQNDGYCSIECSATQTSTSNPVHVYAKVSINGQMIIETSSSTRGGASGSNQTVYASQYMGFLTKGTTIKVKADEKWFGLAVTRTLRIIHK